MLNKDYYLHLDLRPVAVFDPFPKPIYPKKINLLHILEPSMALHHPYYSTLRFPKDDFQPHHTHRVDGAAIAGK